MWLGSHRRTVMFSQLYRSLILLSRDRGLYAYYVQNENNYKLTLGTAHYYILLILQYCNFYAYQFYIF